ncbi:MAG TPA: LuxR C-terminal-related transcriptional regulator [Egibacteraceae bacterium]|nr:LuxR C-terminal-related transcriptional regulator [Egibacteraceae bacterium]
MPATGVEPTLPASGKRSTSGRWLVIAGTAAHDPLTGRAGPAAAWREAYARLASRDRASLTAAELDTLAEALFWMDRPVDSVGVRRDAYAAHVAAGDSDGAAMAAWQLYYEHALVGELAVASGWLERACEHVGARDGSVVDGFVAVAEADRDHLEGRLDDALACAGRAVAIGRTSGDRDLLAMALQTKGRLLVALDRAAEGISLLDEAMVAVINGELSLLFTGWVYCSVLGVCHDIADLRRAAEWTDAALRWCETVNEGLLYPGLCRIHRVELACLTGAWSTAEAEARRACDELLSHDPRYAGEAVYLAAELTRLRGDLDAAEAAFQRAHALGREPQPGLALVWLAQGRGAAAVAALRLALQPGPSAPLARSALLAALVEAEIAAGDLDHAEEALHGLAAVAQRTASPYLEATAAAADGLVRLARGDAAGALLQLRRARALLQDLAMPYEAARVQVAIGMACDRAGDRGTAELELRAAEATFARLGARADHERARGLLGQTPALGPLTPREAEVLRLVAQGRTNRQIATDLVISEHTVSRHLTNMFTKLGVTSRAGATAYAYEHHLVPGQASPRPSSA